MKVYTDYLGNKVECECIGCVEKQGVQSCRTIWESKKWRVHQDFAVPMSGLIVLEPKRHFRNNEEMTPIERGEFVKLYFLLPETIKAVIGCKYLAVALEEESSHWHMWWMPQMGRRLDQLSSIFDRAVEEFKNGVVTIEQIEDINKKIGGLLGKLI